MNIKRTAVSLLFNFDGESPFQVHFLYCTILYVLHISLRYIDRSDKITHGSLQAVTTDTKEWTCLYFRGIMIQGSQIPQDESAENTAGTIIVPVLPFPFLPHLVLYFEKAQFLLPF